MKAFKSKNLISVVFIIMIFAVTIMYIVLPKADRSSIEKRYLADFPECTAETVFNGEFESKFEEYMADHTPLRTFFVGLDAYYNLLIGNNGSNDIYLGKDGNLIEKPAERKNNLETNLNRIVKFSQSIDVPVTLTVAPSKGYIESTKLPANHLEYLDSEYFQTIRNKCSGSLNYVDLEKLFLEKSKEQQLYYKTDHHWNSRAAYIAYGEICDSLGLSKKPESDFNIESYTDFYGTSYSNSGYWFTPSEILEVWRNKDTNGSAKVKITEGKKTEEYNNMFFDENLSGEDKYTVYLDVNHALVTIERPDVKGGTLLLVKDSYAHCLAPFLSENYSKIIMVDLRYYMKPLTEIIKNENVDNVLFMYSMDSIAESTDIILG